MPSGRRTHFGVPSGLFVFALDRDCKGGRRWLDPGLAARGTVLAKPENVGMSQLEPSDSADQAGLTMNLGAEASRRLRCLKMNHRSGVKPTKEAGDARAKTPHATSPSSGSLRGTFSLGLFLPWVPGAFLLQLILGACFDPFPIWYTLSLPHLL